MSDAHLDDRADQGAPRAGAVAAILLALGVLLYLVWSFALLLWVGAYAFQVGGLSERLRMHSDVLLTGTVLLTLVAPVGALHVRRSGLSRLGLLPIAAWAIWVVLTAALVQTRATVPELLAGLSAYVAEGLRIALSAPFVPALYLIGLAALLLIAGLHPGGPWSRRRARRARTP